LEILLKIIKNERGQLISTGFYLSFILIILLVQGGCKSNPENKRESNKTIADTGIVNQSENSGRELALSEAAFTGDKKKITEVIKEGVNINALDEEGRTALMYASFNGFTDILELLIKNGAEVDIADYSGRTALLFASSGPFPETVKLLLDHKADPNVADNVERFTALMYAAAEGHMDVVKILLEHKADPALKDKDGDNAETFARQNGHTEVAVFLKYYN